MSKVLVDVKLLQQLINYFEMDGPEWERYDMLKDLRAALERGLPPVAKPGPDGWTAWFGGECPVRPTIWVEIRLRNGRVNKGLAGIFDWSHDEYVTESDIMAYRVLPNLA